MDFTIEQRSEDALVLRFGEDVDAATNARVQAAARTLRNANLAGITDIAPAYATLLVRFDPLAEAESDSHAAAMRRILATQNKPDRRRDTGPALEIPVCYGGEHGPDLAAVATYAHLSPDEVVARHTASEYTVAMLGFAPGFPYLLGLDPALHAPRRTDPRTRVPTGSVAIGGAQTGIYPRELPGGWNLLGRTPRVLFDPQRDPPCLLSPGQRVRFRAIESTELDATLAGRTPD